MNQEKSIMLFFSICKIDSSRNRIWGEGEGQGAGKSDGEREVIVSVIFPAPISNPNLILIPHPPSLSPSHPGKSGTNPCRLFFSSCVAVTRSDHSVAQLRVAVSQ